MPPLDAIPNKAALSMLSKPVKNSPDQKQGYMSLAKKMLMGSVRPPFLSPPIERTKGLLGGRKESTKFGISRGGLLRIYAVASARTR